MHNSRRWMSTLHVGHAKPIAPSFLGKGSRNTSADWPWVRAKSRLVEISNKKHFREWRRDGVLHLIYKDLVPVGCLGTKGGKATSPEQIGLLRVGDLDVGGKREQVKSSSRYLTRVALVLNLV